jgi:hypothetical protein
VGTDAAPPPATASGGQPASDLAGDAASLSPEELEDITAHAARTGLSAQEAISAYGWHASFARLAGQLESSFPAEFAGARITDSPRQRAFVAFKGEAPAGARAAVRAYRHAAVDLVTHRGFSVRELHDVMVAAHQSVHARKDLVTGVSSHYDLVDGRVFVDAVPASPGDLLPPRRDALVKALRQGLPAGVSDRVEIRLVPFGPTEGG